ncbi:caspase family protein [Actinoplanes aureus]|uniref:Caspase family protein n=1 Tax=Actinoplanes aureus TaxID=2792083 RepID=A0A931CI46_9ACTN|nr:caspase family protein [Actinoplanes aureus]MBG0568427.1 caspase family protein [Actinoplanes aureus]
MARTLFRGHRGDDVRTVQDLLRAADHDPGASDGFFGEPTEAAVRAFQRAQNLVVDGAVGPITLAALRKAGDGKPATVCRALSLHVGINVVDPTKYPVPVPPLRGCENDARDMRALAQAQGFTSTMVLGPAATAQAVIDAITDAAAQLNDGDYFWFTISTHGSQIKDPTGEEPDGLDETLVMYDRQLLDRELSALWDKFHPGVRIFVVPDTCHSGTVTRSADLAYRALAATIQDSPDGFTERGVLLVTPHAERSMGTGLRGILSEIMPAVADALYPTRAVGAEGQDRVIRLVDGIWELLAARLVELDQVDLSAVPRARFLPPEVQEADSTKRAGLYRELALAAGRHDRSADSRTMPAVLAESACQDNQVAMDGRRNGLFTQRFLEVWATGAATDYPDLHRRICELMPPQQTPNLYWATDRDVAFESQRPLVIDPGRGGSQSTRRRTPAGRALAATAG